MNPLTAFALGAASASVAALAVIVALLAVAAWDTRRMERAAARDRHPSALPSWTPADWTLDDDAAVAAYLTDPTNR